MRLLPAMLRSLYMRKYALPLICAASMVPAPAATSTEVTTIVNPMPISTDFFGHGVAQTGNLLAVSAPRSSIGGERSGAILLFDIDTLALVGTITSPRPETDGWFGQSLDAIDGMIIVGTPTSTRGRGRVDFYSMEDPGSHQSLSNPQGNARQFGSAVSLAEGRAIVGAVGTRNMVGEAYLFDISSGSLIATLANPSPGRTQAFGNGGDLTGRTIAIGASAMPPGATFDTHRRQIHVFRIEDVLSSSSDSQAVQIRNVVIREPENECGTDSGFATGFLLTDDFLIAGARNHCQPQSSSGASGVVYIFRLSDGQLVRSIWNPGTNWGENVGFGSSIAVEGDKLAIGCGHRPSSCSAVWVHDLKQGELLARLDRPSGSDLHRNIFFGHDLVFIDGDTLVVSELSARTDEEGRVHIYWMGEGERRQGIEAAPQQIDFRHFAPSQDPPQQETSEQDALRPIEPQQVEARPAEPRQAENCVFTHGVVPAGAGTSQVTYTNSCNHCVRFQPVAEGQFGEPDLPMSDFFALGQFVNAVELAPGAERVMFWGPGLGGSGTWVPTARNPVIC